jgi:probable phosphoglycerate mutase
VSLYLIRHGATAWTQTRRHTGRSDLDLTAEGETQARALAARLAGVDFVRVVSSPLRRARHTAELAGFGDRLEIAPLLREYDYGEYEGLTTAQIQALNPGWDLWRDGCPGGETPLQARDRAARLLADLNLPDEADSALFGHGHIFRALTSAYLGVPVEFCRHLLLGVASISILSHEHGVPAIASWDVT